MDIQLQVSLINAIECIAELTGDKFEKVAKDILGISAELVKELKKLK